jgi:hypothetical protein
MHVVTFAFENKKVQMPLESKSIPSVVITVVIIVKSRVAFDYDSF